MLSNNTGTDLTDAAIIVASQRDPALFAQIFVSVTGIAIMTIVAYYISWSKRQDKPLPKAAAAKAG